MNINIDTNKIQSESDVLFETIKSIFQQNEKISLLLLIVDPNKPYFSPNFSINEETGSLVIEYGKVESLGFETVLENHISGTDGVSEYFYTVYLDRKNRHLTTICIGVKIKLSKEDLREILKPLIEEYYPCNIFKFETNTDLEYEDLFSSTDIKVKNLHDIQEEIRKLEEKIGSTTAELNEEKRKFEKYYNELSTEEKLYFEAKYDKKI